MTERTRNDPGLAALFAAADARWWREFLRSMLWFAGPLAVLFAAERVGAPPWAESLCVWLLLGACAVSMFIIATWEFRACRSVGLVCPGCRHVLAGLTDPKERLRIVESGLCRRCGAAIRSAPGGSGAAVLVLDGGAVSPRVAARLDRLQRASRRWGLVLLGAPVLAPMTELALVSVLRGATGVRHPPEALLAIHGITAVAVVAAIWTALRRLREGSLAREAGLLCRSCGRSLIPGFALTVAVSHRCPSCGAGV